MEWLTMTLLLIVILSWGAVTAFVVAACQIAAAGEKRSDVPTSVWLAGRRGIGTHTN